MRQEVTDELVASARRESRQVLGQVVPVAHEAAEAATEVKDKAIVRLKRPVIGTTD